VRWLILVVLVGCAPTESMSESAPSPAPKQPVKPAVVVEQPPASDAAPACDARAVAAARAAVEAAIGSGVDANLLADCEPEQIVCEAERRPLERGRSCVLVVVDGVTIEGHGEYASHTHGGAPARIGGATFIVENHRATAIDLKLTGTRWLVDHSCELPRTERAKPKPAGLARGEDLVDGEMTVTIPAGAIETVSLGHQVQDAYMAHCDRFATAARFVIDGQAIEVIAEHHVVRREPLRHP
jgi:hypothetical protein